MLFAIKHESPFYYLQRGTWNWSNELDARTVYTGAEVVTRLRDKNFASLSGEVRIVGIRQRSVFEEVD